MNLEALILHHPKKHKNWAKQRSIDQYRENEQKNNPFSSSSSTAQPGIVAAIDGRKKEMVEEQGIGRGENRGGVGVERRGGRRRKRYKVDSYVLLQLPPTCLLFVAAHSPAIPTSLFFFRFNIVDHTLILYPRC